MEAAIRVSTNTGNQAPAGVTPYAAAMSVTECATVNEVTTSRRLRNRRKGMMTHSRNSRWSMPPRIWKNPDLTNTRAA